MAPVLVSKPWAFVVYLFCLNSSVLLMVMIPGLCAAERGVVWGWAEVVHDWRPPLCFAGTSSILAGAALAALQRAAGQAVGTEALIHAVLHLEQVLTTGTKWTRVVENSDIVHRPCRAGSLDLPVAT